MSENKDVEYRQATTLEALYIALSVPFMFVFLVIIAACAALVIPVLCLTGKMKVEK